jgi:hypothetical protein
MSWDFPLYFQCEKSPIKILNKPINDNNLFSKFFIWKAWGKIDVGVKELNLMFYLDIFIYHEDIRVLKIVDFFTVNICLQWQVTIFVQC